MSSLGPIPRKLQEEMLELCHGLCEYCNSNQLENNPHHIPYRSQPGSKNDPDHLVWLCIRCHAMAHRKHIGIPNEIYIAFREWYDNLPVHHLVEWRKNRL